MQSGTGPKQKDIVVLESNRTGADIIVGDVHGEYTCLHRCFEQMKSGDRFFIAGDLVDRGPKSIEVLQLLWNNPDKIFAVRGNHEDLCLAAVEDLKALAPAIRSNILDPCAIATTGDDNSHAKLRNSLKNGGTWFVELFKNELREGKIKINVLERSTSNELLKWDLAYEENSLFKKTIDYFNNLPYIISVKERNSSSGQAFVPGFFVVHADMPVSDELFQTYLAKDLKLSPEEIAYCTWARFNNAHIVMQNRGRSLRSIIAYTGHNINVHSADFAVRPNTNTISLDSGAYLYHALMAVNHTERVVNVYLGAVEEDYTQRITVYEEVRKKIQDHLAFNFSLSLYNAAETGDINIVRDLMRQGVSPLGTYPPLQLSPLFIAAYKNHLEVCQLFLEACNQDALLKEPAKTEYTMAKVHRAVYENDLDELQNYCFEKNINLNSKNPITNLTPLLQAVFRNNKEAVKLLLAAGADPNLGAPLVVACELGRVECAQELINYHANLNLLGTTKQTALTAALKGNHKPCVSLLLDSGADANKRNGEGKTPLNLAVENYFEMEKDLEVVRDLLQHGAKVNKTNENGGSPLYITVRRDSISASKSTDLIELLYAYKALKKDELAAHLFTAISARNYQQIADLLQQGAKLNSRCYEVSPLTYAVKLNDEKSVELLLASGAKPNSHTSTETPLIITALQRGRLNIIKMLLEAGIDVDVVYHGKTVLHYAERFETSQPEIFELIKNALPKLEILVPTALGASADPISQSNAAASSPARSPRFFSGLKTKAVKTTRRVINKTNTEDLGSAAAAKPSTSFSS